MVGGVGGGVLLYCDLGDMVDLVMDLVANLVDNRGSCNMVGSWGNSNSRCSVNLNGLDWGNSMVSNSRGSNWNNWSSVGDRINKTILVHILRKSLQGERGIATVGSDKVT